MNINFHKLHWRRLFSSLVAANGKRREGSSIICHVPKTSPTPWDPQPRHLFFLQTLWLCFSSTVCHKNGAFAQICKVESEQMPLKTHDGKEQLELLQNAVGFSLWSVFQFSQNALFHFLWHCRHLRNSLRTSVDFGRLKNNSIIRKCNQFRVNLLITFYPDQPQKIVVIPPLIERRLHYLKVAQSTGMFARSQPAVFQSGLRGASITDSSERSIKPSIALVLTTPPALFAYGQYMLLLLFI